MLVPKIKELDTIVPIDVTWILECLDEKFDDAISLLPNSCLIYGGAIRDLLAGLPIGGDLDIAVPHMEYNALRQVFDDSVRWVAKPGNILLPKDYNRPSAKIISGITTYTNTTGDEIQLIQACPNEKSMAVSNQLIYNLGVVEIVTNVDLVCSAVMMDMQGNVFEVLPNALKDCKNRILTFNEELKSKEVYKETVIKRIQKLEKRGWVSHVDTTKFKNNSKLVRNKKGDVTTERIFFKTKPNF